MRQRIERVLRKDEHKPKYPKVKYYGPSDYKPITGTIVTPKQSLAVPNGFQKTIYNAFQEIKPFIGIETCSEEFVKQMLSLKGQIQVARNIEQEKFPEIFRLTSQIEIPSMEISQKQKAAFHGSRKKIKISPKAILK